MDGLPGGGFPRCYTALKPVSYTCAKLPVVIYLSGIGQTIAGRCGPCCDDTDDVHAFADLVTNTSKTGGFAMICPHALWFKGSADGQVWPSAMWDIPSPQTDESGQRCSASRDYDMMLALVNDLIARPERWTWTTSMSSASRSAPPPPLSGPSACGMRWTRSAMARR